jgi:hypothetical protein
MSKVHLALIIICLAFAPTIAGAAAVQQVPDIATLKGGVGAFSNVNVDGYAAAGDGGGGQFVQGANCSGGDDGVIIKENGSNKCWYRQFNGAVHMTWYGVTSASPSVTAAQFNAAFDASRNYGNRTVVTDGLAVNYTGTVDLDIPTGDTLDCQGTIGGVSGANWTVPTLPASLIIDPAIRVVVHSRSTLKDCNIRPNWFTTATQMDSTRHIIDNVLHKFSGTGVRCTDDGCSIQDVAVFGFDVGILADTTQRLYMNNVLVDSNVGIWWLNLPGASRNANLLVDPMITQGQNLPSQESWNISGVNASGECQLTLNTTGHDNHVNVGDTVYVFGINATISVIATGNLTSGNATVTNIDPSDLQDIIPGTNVSGTGIQGGSKVVSVDRELGSVTMDKTATGTHVGQTLQFAFANTGPVGCNGRWIVDSTGTSTVTLKGSSVTGASTTGSWSIGSNVITVTSLANIEPGQAVSGTGLSGTVVNVLPAVSADSFRVILSSNATANGTNAPVSFANSAGFSGDGPMLTLSAATRVWTANGSAWGPNAFVTSGIGDGTTMTIGTVGDTTRIQPGMYISLDGSPIGNVTAVDDVNHTITVQQIVSTGMHTLTLTGCGYPGFYSGTKYPWLGNCAATAYLMGGPVADTDEDQGLGVVQAISKGWQIGFHLINALDTPAPAVRSTAMAPSSTGENSASGSTPARTRPCGPAAACTPPARL